MRQVGNNYAFNKAQQGINTTGEVATTKGIGIKTSILIAITFVTAIIMIGSLNTIEAVANSLFIYFGVIFVNFILQMIIFFKPLTAKYLSIPYALFEGLSLGVIVGLLQIAFPGTEGEISGLGLAGLALIVTIAMFLGATILYTTGIIKVGHFFRSFMFSILTGIVIMSLLSVFLMIFAPAFMASLYGSPISIVISVVLVIVSGLYVVISLDNASKMVEANLSKDYEWLASYGILINIIWLFLEVLRLLMILLNNRSSR